MDTVPKLESCRSLPLTNYAHGESSPTTADLALRPSSVQSRLSLPGSGIHIGGVSLLLTPHGRGEIYLNRGLHAFRRAPIEQPDICLEICWRQNVTRRQRPAFSSEALWALFRENDDFIFQFTSPLTGLCPYKSLRMDQNFRVGELVLNTDVLEPYQPVCPLEYPADELLITNYLAHHGLGIEVHGCGLIDSENGGHLFLGHSGAGKSTIARLWELLRHPAILSDDRLILRVHDGELWMYGTPWHGEAAFASPEKAKMNRIFILQHGHENKIVELPKARAAGELFARCFPPFHSVVGLERTMEFLHRVVETVPCYEFRFVPDSRAVEAALDFHG